MKKFSSVDDFISQAPREAQPKLRELRGQILRILPQAHEKIWYGVPFLPRVRRGGRLQCS